jgi:hypothetical protein
MIQVGRFDDLRQTACNDHCDVILLFAAAKLTDSADYAVEKLCRREMRMKR